ncbi:MAG: DsbA family protein [Colwellia sp.]|nr:DsbA family protein [Colwellia sp.]MCW9080481.1 DsbA family protein [Colwellia sp.]
MNKPIDVKLFFNFRSPYCYLASKTLWPIVDDFNTKLIWRPVAGWDLRSSPDRAKNKMPLARQDIARFAKRLNIPLTPPPPTTDPTIAGAASILAEEKGLLRPFIIEVMHKEWAEGLDIGDPEVLFAAGEKIGLNRNEIAEAIVNENKLKKLHNNAEEAAQIGVIGVPTFVIGEQIFWGQDRIDFVLDELRDLQAK